MRTMYDSISPAAIPRDAEMVAGYIDGKYAWKQSDWDRFPDAVHVRITALGLDHGVVLNLEPNGYWPADLGVAWVQRARRRGVDPSIYCNHRNHLHLVRAKFDQAGVPRPHFWVAEYDGVAMIPAGCVAKQHSAPEGTGRAKAPAHYDISIVADHWPGVDEGEEMPTIDEFVDAMKHRVLAGEWRFEGSNVIDFLRQNRADDTALLGMTKLLLAKGSGTAKEVAELLAPAVIAGVLAALPKDEDGHLEVEVDETRIANEVAGVIGRKLGAA